jgi:hypothetical protein
MLKSIYKLFTQDSFYKEVTENFLLPLLVGLFFNLTLEQVLLLIFGCFLIDIDHLFYFFYKKKITFTAIKKISQEEFHKHQPHPYIFHCYELTLLAMFVSYHYSSPLFYLFCGFLVNLLLDTVAYINFYKTKEPWLKFLSLNYLIWSKKS